MCKFAGDSNGWSKAHHDMVTVKVTKIAQKPYTFRVTERRNRQEPPIDHWSTDVHELALPSSGACTKKK